MIAFTHLKIVTHGSLKDRVSESRNIEYPMQSVEAAHLHIDLRKPLDLTLKQFRLKWFSLDYRQRSPRSFSPRN